MRCGSCGPRCGSGGCHDHSSSAEQKPSLGAIDIVDGIFRQAMRNLAKRLALYRAGEMSAGELAAANEKLALWLGATFAGKSRHFEVIEDWHPEGLANELLRVFGTKLSLELPVGDEQIIAEAGRIFAREGMKLLEKALDAGYPPASAAETEPAVIYAGEWANLFSGAPGAEDFG